MDQFNTPFQELLTIPNLPV